MIIFKYGESASERSDVMLSIQAFKMAVNSVELFAIIMRLKVGKSYNIGIFDYMHIVLHVKQGKESSIFSFRSPLILT